jgi:lysophospholipase L1-like esterase
MRTVLKQIIPWVLLIVVLVKAQGARAASSGVGIGANEQRSRPMNDVAFSIQRSIAGGLNSSGAQALPSGDEVKKRIARAGKPTQKNVELTIIGDSISAGALAGTRLGSPSPELIAGIVGAILARDPGEFLNATLNPQAAYPDGEGSWSLRQQLITQYKIPASSLTLSNESAAGRTMSSVTSSFAQRIKPAPSSKADQQVLLMLGSNDFCQGKSPSDFLKTTSEALRHLNQEFPKASFFIAAVPPIDQLKKLGPEPLLGQISCESVQRLYCDRIYATNAAAIIQDYNEGLLSLVAEANRKQAGSRYKFIGMPKDLTLDKSLLAADCFHPGVEGHKKLAATIAPQMSGIK